VTGVALTDGDGLTLTRRARTANRNLVIVVLGVNASDHDLFAALDAGASGFISRDTGAEEIAAIAWHATAAPRVFPGRVPADAVQRRLQTPGRQLSPREYEVLLLLADGLDIPQIRRRLFVSKSTAKTHVANLYEKLGVGDPDQAVITAVRLGLIGD
jgi:DNA-binding NarL/FixJ family response regulator